MVYGDLKDLETIDWMKIANIDVSFSVISVTDMYKQYADISNLQICYTRQLNVLRTLICWCSLSKALMKVRYVKRVHMDEI